MSSKFSATEIDNFLRAVYGAQRINVVPYGYTVTFTALAQNASQTAVLNITGNADFVLTNIRARAQIGAAQTVSTVTAPFVRLQITDSGSNENFANSAVDLVNYASMSFSTAGQLPYPRFIAGRTALTFVATNYAPTAETYTSIDVFFEGVLARAFSGQ